jgi:hypothetical protein
MWAGCVLVFCEIPSGYMVVIHKSLPSNNYSSDLPNHRDCLNSLAETHFICKDATDSIVVQPYLQVKLACISRQYNTQGDTSQFSPSS